MGRPSNIVVVDENYRKLSQSFYEHQKRLGYNLHSCRTRQLYFNEFLHWLECRGNRDITRVTTAEINNYYGYISERPSKKDSGILNPKTTFSHMRMVRDIFEMLLQQGQIKINPTATLQFYYPQEPENPRNAITQQEVELLYSYCRTAQERAILSLAYGCGLRAAELENCNTEDIKLKEKILVVTKGKGNKRRIIPLSNGVVKDLSNYYYNEREALMEGRDYKPGEKAFMLNSRGGRMHDDTYNRRLKMIIERTGKEALQEKQITIHSLRHSIATHLLEQGVKVEQVRIFLGHSQLETTQIYTHINEQQLKKMIEDDT